MKKKLEAEDWKVPFVLLFGVGLSNLGGWIYLIALNLIVLDMTGSPLAVAGLYIVKPLAVLVTNFWAGSVVDRTNQRNLMVGLDIIRAALVVFLPFTSSIWVIYFIVLAINMAGAMFEPASMTYMTRLIPAAKRQRFNALRSLVDSGAFLTGPAIAGILFIIGTPFMALYANVAALLLSGIITMLLPGLNQNGSEKPAAFELSRSMVQNDWRAVFAFSRKACRVMLVYVLFSCTVVLASAIDSQEATFAMTVLHLTNGEYGFLVSLAGAGIVAGAVVNAWMGTRLKPLVLIGAGSVVVSLGYIVYAFSISFLGAGIGFFILAFALAFANTGFQTFGQNEIPVDMMGRVVSVYGLFEAVLTIFATASIGVAAEWLPLRFVVIGAVLVMLTVSGCAIRARW